MSTPVAERSEVGDTRTRYLRDGFLVVNDAFTKSEIAEITSEAVRICRGERGAISGAAPALNGATDDELMARFLCIHHPHKIWPLIAR